VVGGIRPSYLISQLPSNLQPGSVPFYYNPFDENQALQTAALQRLGKASFIDGLAYDNTYQTTVVDQEKYALYANALDYAKAHDLKLAWHCRPSNWRRSTNRCSGTSSRQCRSPDVRPRAEQCARPSMH
jgi:hypothetical protein